MRRISLGSMVVLFSLVGCSSAEAVPAEDLESAISHIYEERVNVAVESVECPENTLRKELNSSVICPMTDVDGKSTKIQVKVVQVDGERVDYSFLEVH